MNTYINYIPYGTDSIIDKLVDDPDWKVRLAIAKLGYGLDKLVNDPIYNIRVFVAKLGYGLDKLVNDEHWTVRLVANLKLKEMGIIHE